MLTILDLLNQITIDPRETELLLAYVLKKDRTYVKAHAKDKVDSKVVKTFLSLTQRRKKHEPIAYLTGEQPFFGRDFIVNRHTLIPRPETEILVELVKQSLQSSVSNNVVASSHRPARPHRIPARSATHQALQARRESVSGAASLGRLGRGTAGTLIVDVGTGSGCLAVTLALECPNATVIASDVSSAALKIAQQNAKQLKADVEFVKDNLLGKKLKSKLNSKLDVVFVANLPYLPSSDKKTMMPDVAKYEPAKALFAGRDGSSLVVKLLKQIRMWNIECRISPRTNIQRSGHSIFSAADIRYSIFLEVDPRQTKKLATLARQLFPKHEVSIKQDLCGRERFLILLPKD